MKTRFPLGKMLRGRGFPRSIHRPRVPRALIGGVLVGDAELGQRRSVKFFGRAGGEQVGERGSGGPPERGPGLSDLAHFWDEPGPWASRRYVRGVPHPGGVRGRVPVGVDVLPALRGVRQHVLAVAGGTVRCESAAAEASVRELERDVPGGADAAAGGVAQGADARGDGVVHRAAVPDASRGHAPAARAEFHDGRRGSAAAARAGPRADDVLRGRRVDVEPAGHGRRRGQRRGQRRHGRRRGEAVGRRESRAVSRRLLARARRGLDPADGADPIALRAGGRAHTTGASRGASEREAAAQHEPSSGATNSARA